MHELRFLGPGEHDDVILESEDGAEQYRLPIDDKLVAALRSEPRDEQLGDQPLSGKDTVSELRPKEIQTRVRAGEDPKTLADEAGVPLDRIMRFAFPVLQERVRIVDEARRGRARGAGSGTGVASDVMDFGPLFDARVARLGTEPASVSWDSFRRPDGGWTVIADFTAESVTAEQVQLTSKFSFALVNRTVSALNDVAADLLHGDPIPALQAPSMSSSSASAFQAPFDVADDSEAQFSRAAAFEPAARLSSVPNPAKNYEQAGADRAWSVPVAHQGTAVASTDYPSAEAADAEPVRGRATDGQVLPIRLPSRRQRAHTHPIPIQNDDELIDDLFDQEADEPAGPGWMELTSDFEQSPDAVPPTTDPLPMLAEPELPPRDEGGAHGGQHHRRSGRASDKPRMPSWDDILLGVRRKTEGGAPVVRPGSAGEA